MVIQQKEELMITISETKDAKLIARLSEEVFNLHASLHPKIFKQHNQAAVEKTLEFFFADPSCRGFVAKQGGVEIGYAVFLIKEAEETDFLHKRKLLYIDQICVLEKYQRTGAGKLLMEQAEKLAKENSIDRITLDHWTSNVEAASYFRKKGYSPYREMLFKSVG